MCGVEAGGDAAYPRVYRTVLPFTPTYPRNRSILPYVNSAKSEKHPPPSPQISLTDKNKTPLSSSLWTPKHQPLPSLPTPPLPCQFHWLINMFQEQNVFF